MLDGSGAGKSATYSKPNAYSMLGSYIFTDPKGELYDDTAGYLKSHGYDIKVLNLVNPANSDGYNPLMHVASELDVDVIANTVVKGQASESKSDPYWDDMAEMLLKALIYYLIATRPEEEQNLASCSELVRAANTNGGSNLLTELISKLPYDHPARMNYKSIEIAPEKTYSSILSTLQSKLGKFDSKEIAEVIQPQFKETDLATITTIVTRYYNQNTWKSDLVFERDSFELLQDILDSAGELEKRAPYDKLVTTEFAQNAIR